MGNELMKRDEAEKLLGGYATGSLTGEERELLFTAALEDQKLFEALADEEALRDALSDEAFKRELIVALSEPQPSLWGRLTAWWQRPYSLALAGGIAAVLLAAVIVQQMASPDAAPQEVAMVEHKRSAAESEEFAVVPEPVEESASAPAPVAVPSGKPEPMAEAVSTERPEETRREVVGQSQFKPPPVPKLEMADAIAPAAPPAAAATTAQEEGMMVSRLRQAASKPAAPSERRLAFQTAAGGERAILSGLRYTIERSTSGGAWAKVSAESLLGVGDTVRLRVEADVTGYLQVTDSAFPEQPAVFNGSVAAGGVYLIPSAGGLPAPQQGGPRTIQMVLSGARTGVEQVTLRYAEP